MTVPYVRVFATANRSVVCLQRSWTLVLLGQLKFSEMILRHFVPFLYALTAMQNFTEIFPGEPLRRELNARLVDKYSDFGPVEGYISETVQYTASEKIND